MHILSRAREALRSCLPELLRNPQFTSCLKNDETTRRWECVCGMRGACWCCCLEGLFHKSWGRTRQEGMERPQSPTSLTSTSLRMLMGAGDICRWLAQLLMNVGFPESAAGLATDIVSPTPLIAA